MSLYICRHKTGIRGQIGYQPRSQPRPGTRRWSVASLGPTRGDNWPDTTIEKYAWRGWS